VRLDQSLDDVQAETGSADVARGRCGDALELLEQLGDVLGRDPEPAIVDGDLDLLPGDPCGHAYGRLVGRVLDGVVDQVDEDLLELGPVHANRGKLVADVERDSPGAPLAVELGHEFPEERGQRHLRPLDADPFGIDA
jgi:hypothetical protein